MKHLSKKLWKIKGDPEQGDISEVFINIIVIAVFFVGIVIAVNLLSVSIQEQAVKVSKEIDNTITSASATPSENSALEIKPSPIPTSSKELETEEVKTAKLIIQAQKKYRDEYLLHHVSESNGITSAHYGGGLMEINGDEKSGYVVIGFGLPFIGNDDDVEKETLSADGEAWFGYWGTGLASMHHVAIFKTREGQIYYISNNQETPILYSENSKDSSVEYAVAKKLSESLLS